VAMMNFTHAPTIQTAVDQVVQKMPQADVAIFPSGGTIIPEVQ